MPRIFLILTLLFSSCTSLPSPPSSEPSRLPSANVKATRESEDNPPAPELYAWLRVGEQGVESMLLTNRAVLACLSASSLLQSEPFSVEILGQINRQNLIREVEIRFGEVTLNSCLRQAMSQIRVQTAVVTHFDLVIANASGAPTSGKSFLLDLGTLKKFE